MATSRFVVAAVVALTSLLVLPTSVVASRPLYGTGTSTLIGSDILSFRQADGNILIEQQNTRLDDGAFTGTVDEHLWLVVHPNGLITLHAEAVLSGTYPACGSDPVTQSIRLAGEITPAGDIWANFATVQGAAVAVQGTVSGSAASLTSNFEIAYHC
ncbi:MAG TPA: hypothetical protein VM032_11335 [Vicinamibacterales bacterium]|nr:hypothetical protein [Vicinamibacterales bacterium]